MVGKRRNKADLWANGQQNYTRALKINTQNPQLFSRQQSRFEFGPVKIVRALENLT